MHKQAYDFSTPTFKSHNVLIRNQGVTTHHKTHKTQNKSKLTRILKEHTCTKANTLAQKHNITHSATRPHIYTKLATNNEYI